LHETWADYGEENILLSSGPAVKMLKLKAVDDDTATVVKI
jgi:hypothetical protein